jgi:hypothetical protein
MQSKLHQHRESPYQACESAGDDHSIYLVDDCVAAAGGHDER